MIKTAKRAGVQTSHSKHRSESVYFGR